MSDQHFRQILQTTYKKSQLRAFRVGVPAFVGLLVLTLGFIQEGLALPLVGSLMLYIAWLQYENCRTAGEVFRSMEYLASRYQKHGAALHQKNS